MNRENPASLIIEELPDLMRESPKPVLAQPPKRRPQTRQEPPHPKVEEQPTVYSAEDLDFVIADVEWLWNSWLPNGFLTILVARAGLGKSLLALYLAKVISQGLSWPDGTAFNAQSSGKVLWCEAESCQALLKQRIQRLAIHKSAILLPLRPLDDVNLGNISHREAIVRVATQAEVRLIILDSLRGCHREDENSSGLVNIIAWLSQLARDTGKALVAIHHLRKRSQLESSAATLERMRGSSVISQLARSIWALEEVRGSDLLKLSCLKSNLALKPDPLGMLIDSDGIPQFTSDLPEMRLYETQLEEVQQWLQQLLADRGPLPLKIIQASGREIGYNLKTIQRAANRLSVVRTRTGRQTAWRLPTHPRLESLLSSVSSEAKQPASAEPSDA